MDLKQLAKEGAVILDVRSPAEFSGGHVKEAVNIPLQQIEKAVSKFKKEQVIITCCASGMRSGSAKSFLKSKGFSQVYNGGAWTSLRSKI